MDPNAVDMSAEMQAKADAARAESAPAEPNIESQTPLAGESTQPDSKDGKFVPLENFLPVREKAKELERENAQLREQLQRPVTPPIYPAHGTPPVAPLDPEVVPAVRQIAWQMMEEQRASEFIARHGAEMQDPVLRGAVSAIIQDANQRQQTISQEDALTEAKRLLEARATPKVVEAQTQGFTEGQDIALARQKAGAVGDTTKSAPPVDPDKMNAAEFAKYMNIPRHTG